MSAQPYFRKVHYYETDQMGVVHHSNYIRWFEEARVEYMRSLGCDYRTLEESGVIIPVVDVSCKYLQSARFDDELEIHVHLRQFNGVRMIFAYEVKFTGTETLAATGTSTHCFLNEARKPISIKRQRPEDYQLLLSCVETE